MSHFTKIATELKQLDHLATALRALGYTVATNSAVRGWKGMTTTAELVVCNPGKNGHDIGFVRPSPDAAFEIVADWYGMGVHPTTFRNAVAQEYAAVGAETAARKSGWTNIKREQRPDGTLVLTGTRH